MGRDRTEGIKDTKDVSAKRSGTSITAVHVFQRIISYNSKPSLIRLKFTRIEMLLTLEYIL
jgi:hypothetical protein